MAAVATQLTAPPSFGAPAPPGRHEPNEARAFLRRFVLRSRGHIAFLPVERVDWIEANGGRAHLHGDGRAWKVRELLLELEADLDPASFVRIHRSAIVNLESVRRLLLAPNGDLALELRCGRRLSVSRQRRPQIRDRLAPGLVAGADARCSVRMVNFASVARLAIRAPGSVELIDPTAIESISADRMHSVLHAGAAVQRVRISLHALLATLAPTSFLRLHRSHIVATQRIERIEVNDSGAYAVVLASGRRIAVGRSFVPTLKPLLHGLL